MTYPNQTPAQYPTQAGGFPPAPGPMAPPPVGAPGGYPQAPAGYPPAPAGAPPGYAQALAPAGYPPAPAQYPPQGYGAPPAADPAMFGHSAVPDMFAGTTAQEGIDRLPQPVTGMSRLQVVKTEWKARSSSIVVTWKYLAAPADRPDLLGRECAKVYATSDSDPKAAQKKAEDWTRMVIKFMGFSTLEAANAAGQHPYAIAKQIGLGQKPLDGRVADCNCVFSGRLTRANPQKGYAGGDPINNQSWAIAN
jgi:hypothetical protein